MVSVLGVLFIIPVIIDAHGHKFEIYALGVWNSLKCRFSFDYKECIGIRRCDKFKRLLLQILQQICTNLSRERSNIEAKWPETDKSEDSICRWKFLVWLWHARDLVLPGPVPLKYLSTLAVLHGYRP